MNRLQTRPFLGEDVPTFNLLGGVAPRIAAKRVGATGGRTSEESNRTCAERLMHSRGAKGKFVRSGLPLLTDSFKKGCEARVPIPKARSAARDAGTSLGPVRAAAVMKCTKINSLVSDVEELKKQHFFKVKNIQCNDPCSNKCLPERNFTTSVTASDTVGTSPTGCRTPLGTALPSAGQVDVLRNHDDDVVKLLYSDPNPTEPRLTLLDYVLEEVDNIPLPPSRCRSAALITSASETCLPELSVTLCGGDFGCLEHNLAGDLMACEDTDRCDLADKEAFARTELVEAVQLLFDDAVFGGTDPDEGGKHSCPSAKDSCSGGLSTASGNNEGDTMALSQASMGYPLRGSSAPPSGESFHGDIPVGDVHQRESSLFLDNEGAVEDVFSRVPSDADLDSNEASFLTVIDALRNGSESFIVDDSSRIVEKLVIPIKDRSSLLQEEGDCCSDCGREILKESDVIMTDNSFTTLEEIHNVLEREHSPILSSEDIDAASEKCDAGRRRHSMTLLASSREWGASTPVGGCLETSREAGGMSCPELPGNKTISTSSPTLAFYTHKEASVDVWIKRQEIFQNNIPKTCVEEPSLPPEGLTEPHRVVKLLHSQREGRVGSVSEAAVVVDKDAKGGRPIDINVSQACPDIIADVCADIPPLSKCTSQVNHGFLRYVPLQPQSLSSYVTEKAGVGSLEVSSNNFDLSLAPLADGDENAVTCALKRGRVTMCKGKHPPLALPRPSQAPRRAFSLCSPATSLAGERVSNNSHAALRWDVERSVNVIVSKRGSVCSVNAARTRGIVAAHKLRGDGCVPQDILLPIYAIGAVGTSEGELVFQVRVDASPSLNKTPNRHFAVGVAARYSAGTGDQRSISAYLFCSDGTVTERVDQVVGVPYARPYRPGSQVTVHFNISKRELGYSINGRFLGVAFRFHETDVSGPFYPIVVLGGECNTATIA